MQGWRGAAPEKQTERDKSGPVRKQDLKKKSRQIPDRDKEVFSPHVRVVSKCALKKSRLKIKISLLFRIQPI